MPTKESLNKNKYDILIHQELAYLCYVFSFQQSDLLCIETFFLLF